jgi:tetratricopeptide (TPR) repeat protein
MISVGKDMLLSRRQMTLLFVAVLLLGLSWVGYRYYRSTVERAAYKELAESIDEYTKVTAYATDETKLVDVERAFAAGAEQHRSSVLYPFFVVFQADVLIRQGKLAEGASLLDKAVGAMDRQHPLYYLYALKAALVKIDTKDAALEKKGRDELTSLSSNVANPLQDMALYYKALDADTRGEQDVARSIFKEIIAHNKKDSYWYQLADAKLNAGG